LAAANSVADNALLEKEAQLQAALESLSAAEAQHQQEVQKREEAHARKAKQQSTAGWVAGVIKKTWWPFTIVLVLAMVFAFYAKSHHPEAKTFREVTRAAIA